MEAFLNVESLPTSFQVFGWFDSRHFDDKIGLALCAAGHVDKITLDYTGGVVINIHALEVGFVKASPSGIRNNMLADMQCFVHINCHRTPVVEQWMQWYWQLGYLDFEQQLLRTCARRT